MLHMWMGGMWEFVQTSNCTSFHIQWCFLKNGHKCGSWYGINQGGFIAMFVDPHLLEHESDSSNGTNINLIIQCNERDRY
jgi:hypothetical protein